MYLLITIKKNRIYLKMKHLEYKKPRKNKYDIVLKSIKGRHGDDHFTEE